MSKNASFMIIFGLLLVCIQVKQKSFITADIIGTIQNNPDLVINYKNFVMSSMWNINRGTFCFKTTKPSYVCLLLLMCGDIEQCPGPPFPELSNLSRSKGIKMLHQNIKGLFNKIPDIQVILYEFNLHVLTLSETYINSNNYNYEVSLYEMPGYDFIKKNKIKGPDGGVAMFISNTLKWQRRYDLERDELESIWIEIFPHNARSFLLFTIYRPHYGSKYLFKNFNTLLNDTLNVISFKHKECIILGDTNINYLDKNNHNDIKDIFTLNGYKQLVTKATRITEKSKTLIDAIFTNKPENISKTDTIPTSLSDHDMVGCVRKLNHL